MNYVRRFQPNGLKPYILLLVFITGAIHPVTGSGHDGDLDDDADADGRDLSLLTVLTAAGEATGANVSGFAAVYGKSDLTTGSHYYIDYETGDDSNNGLSSNTPWKHAPGYPEATGVVGSTVLQPGDVVLFKGGVHYRGSLNTLSDGTALEPIVYKGDGWGSGKAIIDGSIPITEQWTRCASADEVGGNPNWQNLYWITVPEEYDPLYTMFFNGDSKMHLAQDPDLPDPYWEDDRDNYYPVDLENITRTSITDPGYFTQSDPAYWDGAYLFVWVNPNVIATAAVTGYTPSSGTITFEELHENAMYGGRDQYYSMINHPSLLTVPGEYFLDEARDRLYFWPINGPELSVISFITRPRIPDRHIRVIIIKIMKHRFFIGSNIIGPHCRINRSMPIVNIGINI